MAGTPKSFDVQTVAATPPSHYGSFWGLSLTDFKNLIPAGDPRLDPFMEELEPIVDQNGSSLKIDDYQEAEKAQKLWSKYFLEGKSVSEYDQFLGNYAKIYFSSHRDEIKKTYFPVMFPDHPFAKLFDTLPLDDLPDMRGLVTFTETAFLAAHKLPQIVRDRVLSVLYPASGSHVAALYMSLMLMDANIIDRANFVFTEIDANRYQDLQRCLNEALAQGVFDKVEYSKPQNFEEGNESKVVITYQGKPITLTFALNRSGKDYFRPEYLEQADVVVIHDPGSDGDIQHSFDLLSQVLMAKKTAGIQKGQLVVMEKTTPYDGNGFSGGSLLPKEMWNRELTGPFGHCGGYKGVGEVEGCHFKTAQLIDLNDLSLQTLVQAAPNAAALSFKLFRPEMRPSIATP
ncbi:MAG TPA: hypothetical protein DDW49_08885 [Deltaproteobacteria bacterium]|nr:MAG: hypothetical protein A2048_06905 [Deltaproteobacteria bacterium GWA2_45_12]HBF13477.1 hypothetical protein [Deltaproteobacteria bacterium]